MRGKKPLRINKWKDAARDSDRYCMLWCVWWSLIKFHELSETLKLSTRPTAFLSKIRDIYFIKYYVHELELFQIELVHLIQGTDLQRIYSGTSLLFPFCSPDPPKKMVSNSLQNWSFLIELVQIFSRWTSKKDRYSMMFISRLPHSMKCYLWH